MPHKRAKKSVRDADKASKGYDNAPTGASSLSSGGEGISKTVYRILNAEKIRKEKLERMKEVKEGSAGKPGSSNKRKADDSQQGTTSAKPAAKKLKINPGENLKSFNDRVEASMRTEISSAIRQSKAARKKAKLSRSKGKDGNDKDQSSSDEEGGYKRPPPRPDAKGKARAIDFAERERVRLNDVAMEPPSLRFGKKAEKAALTAARNTAAGRPGSTVKDLPVSMKQKQEMEQARLQAIERYRELKAHQLADKGLQQT